MTGSGMSIVPLPFPMCFSTSYAQQRAGGIRDAANALEPHLRDFSKNKVDGHY
jgi:hypothetical protein